MENNDLQVELAYFNPDGSLFESVTYLTQYRPIHKIWNEIESALELNVYPGLVTQQKFDFHTLINIPDHEHNQLHLILNKKTKEEIKGMNLKEFMQDRTTDLEQIEQVKDRQIVDSLICLKFVDGHIHFLLPNQTPIEEFTKGLQKELEKIEKNNIITTLVKKTN